MQSTNKFKWNAGHVDYAIICVVYSYMNELSSGGMKECNAALPHAQRENLIKIKFKSILFAMHLVLPQLCIRKKIKKWKKRI